MNQLTVKVNKESNQLIVKVTSKYIEGRRIANNFIAITAEGKCLWNGADYGDNQLYVSDSLV